MRRLLFLQQQPASPGMTSFSVSLLSFPQSIVLLLLLLLPHKLVLSKCNTLPLSPVKPPLLLLRKEANDHRTFASLLHFLSSPLLREKAQETGKNPLLCQLPCYISKDFCCVKAGKVKIWTYNPRHSTRVFSSTHTFGPHCVCAHVVQAE